MNGWIYTHQLDPILVRFGELPFGGIPIQVTWYGSMYALGFLLFYGLAIRTARWPDSAVKEIEVGNLLLYIIVGVVVGARIGWVVFYGGLPYFFEPLRILETWKGGMSFHGGFLGIVIAYWIYSRVHDTAFLDLADFSVTWAPLGLFFGRIGNFINGELYGKPTNGTWGVIFPDDPQRLPRHPSQLYEAALEGLLIFGVLILLRFRAPNVRGIQPAVFILLYGIVRTAVEFVRLPDREIGYTLGFITRGQMLSVPMVIVGLVWLIVALRLPRRIPRLIAAAAEGNTKRVRALLNDGADVNARDTQGRTALARAAERGHNQIAKLLEKAGAAK